MRIDELMSVHVGSVLTILIVIAVIVLIVVIASDLKRRQAQKLLENEAKKAKKIETELAEKLAKIAGKEELSRDDVAFIIKHSDPQDGIAKKVFEANIFNLFVTICHIKEQLIFSGSDLTKVLFFLNKVFKSNYEDTNLKKIMKVIRSLSKQPAKISHYKGASELQRLSNEYCPDIVKHL